jgi:hypothetical protein
LGALTPAITLLDGDFGLDHAMRRIGGVQRGQTMSISNVFLRSWLQEMATSTSATRQRANARVGFAA